jgi:hypothetical protein
MFSSSAAAKQQICKLSRYFRSYPLFSFSVLANKLFMRVSDVKDSFSLLQGSGNAMAFVSLSSQCRVEL